MSTKAQTALITGASAGIGKALANECAANGFNVVLVARREDRLQALAKELAQLHGVQTYVVVLDLAKAKAPKELFKKTKELGLHIDLLVNNAGFALHKPFTQSSWKEHQESIQVMMTSLTELCYLFVKPMLNENYGRIINVASAAAMLPPMKGSLYTGIKAFVLHTSQALDMEVKERGVHVTALCPGFTHTEFHDVMGVGDAMKSLPNWVWMSADDVAKQAFSGVMKGQPVVVNGVVNRVATGLMGLIPSRVQYGFAKRSQMFDEL